jgi:uncharacterized protein
VPKIIRDTVHGDIELTADELKVIYTAEFQRLHGCRQLGLTYLVYPGAKHSRFEHVLGVMHIATKIAKRLTGEGPGNFFKPKDDDGRLKTLRLAALLHDMGHVPFGHTLEDEMPLIAEHDAASEGAAPPRWEAPVTDVLRKSGNADFIAPVIGVLRAITASKDDDELYKLVGKGTIEPQLLVLADIIGNTICADLLDYIRRDYLMTGIHAVYDDRIFQYFAVAEHTYDRKSYQRLIIKLVKHGRVRYDCLADLLDILKLRYNLSDKVLYHPRKCAADAMLIRAVGDLGLRGDGLMKFSDDGLLDEYRADPLIAALRSRRLFTRVFVCRREHIWSYDEKEKSSKKELIERLHREQAFRQEIEKKVERELGLPANTVLIFCPQLDMTRKPVRVLVQWNDGTIRRLNDIDRDDDTFTRDQVDVLERMYAGLWKLYLFVRPDLRTRGHRIRQKFIEILKVDAGLDATCDPATTHYLENSPEYAIGRRLDEELEITDDYSKLPVEKRLVAWGKCHGQLPVEKYDEDYVDADATTIASRTDDPATSNLIRDIIRSVLGDPKSSEGRGPGLPFGRQ